MSCASVGRATEKLLPPRASVSSKPLSARRRDSTAPAKTRVHHGPSSLGGKAAERGEQIYCLLPLPSIDLHAPIVALALDRCGHLRQCQTGGLLPQPVAWAQESLELVRDPYKSVLQHDKACQKWP